MKYATELDLSYNNTMTIFIDQIKEGSTVLEFGPASGRLTRYLKNELNCSVYIVEIDEEAGKIAAEAATDYVIGDILEYKWLEKFEGVKFDYILFADVLEHLTDAVGVLKKCATVLKDNGKICFSVPNIAHNSVIINLLENKFRYISTGIMDNTHVHFYTKENADALAKDSGYFVEKKYATYTQVGKNEFDNSYDNVDSALAHELKTRPFGEVYQYVYVISKDANVVTEDNITEYADYDYAQIFVDYKGDYEEIKKDYLKADKPERTFVIENVSKAKKLRFDPALSNCVIKLTGASGYVAGEKKSLVVESHNASIVLEGNNYYFGKEDPQIHFLLDDKVDYDKIEIEVSYMNVTDVKTDKNLYNIMDEAVEKINNLNASVGDLSLRLSSREHELEEERDENRFLREFASQRFIGRIFAKYCEKHGRTLK